MENAEKRRLDIYASDVFISWTGNNKELKDQIKKRLTEEYFICTDSETACQGNFEQWSIEAAISSTVFLMILTKETLGSKYVPKELESALKMDDAETRIIVVCSDDSLYNNLCFSNTNPDVNIATNALAALKISAIFMPNDVLTDEILDDIYIKTANLIVNRFDKIYREKTKPDYVRLIPLYKQMQKTSDREFSYESLYIPRTVTERDENDDVIATYESPSDFIKSEGIFFLCGSGGSGKTQYINQIRGCIDDKTVLISLSCSNAAGSGQPLFNDMYEEFCRVLENADFYTENSFKRLLSVRHIILVLDGMDEIGTEDGMRAFLRKVEDYYKPNAKNTTLFFTGRNIQTADSISMNGQRARKLYLDKLTDDKIKMLGDNLFLLFDAENKAKEFYVSVNVLSDEIKSNPLLLSQLAIIYKDSGNVPKTIVGIFDAISEITFRMDTGKMITDIPDSYRDMIKNIGTLLKEFSNERYRLLSEGKIKSPVKIFSKILNKYDDKVERAEFLTEYLENRAIWIDGEFSHKMFLEYFTAVYYYEHTFDDYDELENTERLKELFAHYSDPYWAQVIQLFLIKADSCIDSEMTHTLYREVIAAGEVTEYTLLFDTCRDLICHREEAQVTLVTDILYKSAEKGYPPYGPLFWYVPEYDLYEAALLAAKQLNGNAKALALVRDVCYIYGQKNSIAQITDKISGQELFDAASSDLKGVRRALLEIFLLGDADYEGGNDIYPRFFNVAETRSLRDYGCGVGGRMHTPFEDELAIYEHTSFNELNGEFIGLISCSYDDNFEGTLRTKTTYKVTGLAFSPADREVFTVPKFYARSLRVLYYPENVHEVNGLMSSVTYDCLIGSSDFIYLRDKVSVPPERIAQFIDCGAFKICEHIIEIDFPESVTEFGQLTFLCCSSLKDIHVPESVTEIGKWAFWGCSALKEIHIPEGVTKIECGVFSGCSSLKEIRIPEGVTEIGECAFSVCSSLKEIHIPEGVTEIGGSAFKGCSSLKEIHIPEGVTKIGGSAFEGCSALKEIHIPESVAEIGDRAFHDCSSLEEIHIPEGVTEIGWGAFSGCGGLQEIHIPEGVTDIGDWAFHDCSSLEGIHVPEGVTEIGGSAFEGCSSLKEIHIPEGVTKIMSKDFYGCSSLEKIHIPESVTGIGESAFEGCSSLKEIHIPEGVTEIGSNIFCGCDSLKLVKMPQRFSLQEYKELIFCGADDISVEWIPSEDAEKIITTPENEAMISPEAYRNNTVNICIISNGVSVIGSCAFENCKFLKEIRIPEGVTKIEWGVFSGCRGLQEIHIPEGVTDIGDWAFNSCSALKEIHIPEGVTKIEIGVFSGCSSLKEIHIPESVTEIGGSAFDGCSSLSEIHIPEGVTIIESGAFSGCSGLEKIHIPEGVTEIGVSAFEGCSSLKEIYIPEGVTIIGDAAFKGCSSLKEIRIPESVTRIEMYAFNDCSGLQKIHIPDSVTKIRNGAFSGCSSLKEIHVPEGVTKIEKSAFEGCSSLQEIHIPENVTEIGDAAFSGCAGLTEVTIPVSVYQIGDDAFKGCTGLKSVTISANFKNDIERIFGNIDTSIVHFV